MAQSLADPRPKFDPAMTTKGTWSSLYLTDASKTVVDTPEGWCMVNGPIFVRPFITFFNLLWLNVPRAITWKKNKGQLKSVQETVFYYFSEFSEINIDNNFIRKVRMYILTWIIQSWFLMQQMWIKLERYF